MPRYRNIKGTVYLTHFDRPLHHAQHYLGWTQDLKARIEAHRRGEGARLLQVINELGISWEVVWVWHNVTRRFERFMKKRWGGSIKFYCPVCRQQFSNHLQEGLR